MSTRELRRAEVLGRVNTHSDWWIPQVGSPFSPGDFGYAMKGAFGYGVPTYLLGFMIKMLSMVRPHAAGWPARVFVYSSGEMHNP